jgi:hypothetical protein
MVLARGPDGERISCRYFCQQAPQETVQRDELACGLNFSVEEKISESVSCNIDVQNCRVTLRLEMSMSIVGSRGRTLT